MKNKLQLEEQRHVLRLLKLLSKRLKTGLIYKEESKVLILFLNEKQYRFSLDIVTHLKNQKHILMRNDSVIINNSGLTYLKRSLNPDALLASAQNNIVTADINLKADFIFCESNLGSQSLSSLILLFEEDYHGQTLFT